MIDNGERGNEGMRDNPCERNGGIESAHRMEGPGGGEMGLGFGGSSFSNGPKEQLGAGWRRVHHPYVLWRRWLRLRQRTQDPNEWDP